MKNYLLLTLITALFMGVATEYKLHLKTRPSPRVPQFLSQYAQEVKASFKRPEYGNLLMSFLLGVKQGISPQTRKAYETNGLSFLLSPSGIHLTSFFILLSFALKYFVSATKRKWIKVGFLFLILFSPTAQNLKRLALLRLFFHAKYNWKKKTPSTTLLVVVFICSFCLGHYFESPYSFAISFLYIGTFFLFSDQSRIKFILALFANQILIGLFLGSKVSFFSVFTSLIGVFIFSFLQPLCLIYFLTYWLYKINWLESIIHLFTSALKSSMVALTGTFTSTSLFLLLAILALIHIKQSKQRACLFMIFLLFHTNTSMTPCLFRPH